MNMEQWIIARRIQLTVKLQVIIIFKVSRFESPCRFGVINNFVFPGFNHFTIFPLFLFSKCNINRKELAIFFQELFNPALLKKLF